MAKASWRQTSNHTQYYVVGDRGGKRHYYCGYEHGWRVTDDWARTFLSPEEPQKDFWWAEKAATHYGVINLRLVKALMTVETRVRAYTSDIEVTPLVKALKRRKERA